MIGGTMTIRQFLKMASTREKLEYASNLPSSAFGDYGKGKIFGEALLEILDRLEAIEAKIPDLEELE